MSDRAVRRVAPGTRVMAYAAPVEPLVPDLTGFNRPQLELVALDRGLTLDDDESNAALRARILDDFTGG